MKKLLILALVALVAGSAFATTDPAFSGEFVYSTQFDFDDEYYAVSDGDGSAKVSLNGVVDDFSTVSAEFSADSDSPLELNEFTLTTDITGALGVDGPVGVSITWGGVTMQAAEYQKVAGYEDKGVTSETNTYIGAKLTFTIVEKVKLVTILAPATYLGDTWLIATDDDTVNGGVAPPVEPVYGFDLQFAGLVEGLDFNIYFVSDENNTGGNDEPFQQLGLTAGYTIGDLAAGLAFDYGLDTEVAAMGVSAQYTISPIVVGVAFGVGDFSAFTDNAAVGLNLTWTAAPVLDVFVAAQMGFADVADSFGMDAGLVFKLGATSYTVGYEYNNSHFKAPDNDLDIDAETIPMDGMFFKVSASF